MFSSTIAAHLGQLLLAMMVSSCFVGVVSQSYINDKLREEGSCFPAATSTTSYICKGDNVTAIPDNMPPNITQLNLSGTRLTTIPSHAFAMYPNLLELDIKNSSLLREIKEGAFRELRQLRILVIIDCVLLTTIGPGVLGTFQNLHTLRIWKSGLTTVPDFSTFSTMSPSHNQSMYEIDLTINKIKRIPKGSFRNIRTWLLRLEYTMIEEIEDYAFKGSQIFNLDFQNNPNLQVLGENAFSGIADLNSLSVCARARAAASISIIFFRWSSEWLTVSRNLSKTRISYLPTEGLSNISELNVEDTPSLKQFPSVFKFSRIDVARLTYPHHCCAFQHPEKQNPLEYLEHEARRQKMMLQHLCVTSSPAPHLSPSSPPDDGGGGLGGFHDFHPAVSLRRRRRRNRGPRRAAAQHAAIQPNRRVRLRGWDTVAAGCLATGSATSRMGKPTTHAPARDGVGGPEGNFMLFPQYAQHSSTGGHNDEWWGEATNVTVEHDTCSTFTVRKNYANVICTPQPNAFNPCEDVMGYEWLRVVVWFVLLAALCGNMVVIVVLVTGRGKMTVPKFLMCNLSFADLLMGLYLLLLASIDVHSLGEYFTHAVSWQNDGGCQVAGFLTVFSSELSVFVLMVITVERWYAISYAIHLTKRLRIKQAWGLMLTGWLYASTMALLPLVGVSGYGAVSMCLPMEAKDIWDKLYIVAILLLNGLAFTVICGCYISMFMKVRASDTMARSNDATIAKRMSILVLTNFICWAPIAFFGLTASFGFPMIDISNSKILLVFFYPLNSCANPFLYVILTKQFRKDVFILLGRYGVCTQRANQYKGTLTRKSVTTSRHNGLVLQSVPHHHSDLTFLSHVSTKSSRCSLNGNTPKHSPQGTPHASPRQSPREAFKRLGFLQAASSLVSQAAAAAVSAAASGGGGGGGGGAALNGSSSAPETPNSGGGGVKHGAGKERRLSVVPESSQVSDDGGSGTHEERVLEARDSLRDLFDGKPLGRVRSASEYVVLYPPAAAAAAAAKDRDLGREGRRRSSRYLLDKQPSLDTSISSNTETSYISDSSWTRMDSFGSGQEGEWPGTARAVATSRKTSMESGCGERVGSPSLACARIRTRSSDVTAAARQRLASDGDSPTRPLPHYQLVRITHGSTILQDDNCSSGTDEDYLDDESKVKQSLL
ncbi:uncharacterized protein LOC112570446 [Pomacea canaliculata]|uniref:uncharacterized protein LOC112570446 n=1 Tax=Pomacea canaliculata TaxID=400727 RepID=UPI000D734CD7|nr:uncharacterized protein LOC112570446 [Pomacea canaliculata]